MGNWGKSGDEGLRGDLRDYFGTAMFNGNPMAMMELEEAERASGDELRDLARRHGIDPSPYYDAPTPRPSYGSGSYGSGAGSGYGTSGVGVSVSTRTETIGPAATRFFDSGPASRDTGFFANYGQSLKRKALREVVPGDQLPLSRNLPTENSTD